MIVEAQVVSGKLCYESDLEKIIQNSEKIVKILEFDLKKKKVWDPKHRKCVFHKE